MKLITAQILDFLDKQIKHKYSNISNAKLSRFSISLLTSIFKTMISAEREYIEPSSSWLSMSIHNLPKGYDFEYCEPIIKSEIENMKNTACIYSFSIKNRDFQIAFVSPYKKSECEQKFNTYIKRIYIWLYIATTYSPPICSQKLNIYLYLTSLKKSTPSNQEIFSQIHANTAFTTSCKKNTEIHIYREEEWFKVLVHESFHCFGLDFSAENQQQINKEIQSIFPIKTRVNAFEVYCEMFAEIINVMFVSHHLTSKIENLDNYIDKMIEKTQRLLNKERIFSLFQCSKVLNCYGIKYTDLFEKTDSAALRRLHYRENNTNIFSYYILKSFFMFFYDDFLAWCFLHNQGSIAFNRKNMAEFVIFIKEHYSQKDFLKEIENMERFFIDNRGKNINNTIMKNMRMSLYEL